MLRGDGGNVFGSEEGRELDRQGTGWIASVDIEIIKNNERRSGKEDREPGARIVCDLGVREGPGMG